MENGYPVDDVFILRIGRDEGEGFEEHKVDKLDLRWNVFWHLLNVYDLEKQIRRVRIGKD